MFFKLTLDLATPFYMRNRLTLDGLLSAAIHNQTGKRGLETVEHIPLAREHGIFKGSSIFCHPRYRHQRFDRVMTLQSERDLSTSLFQPNARGGRYGRIDQRREAYKTNLDSYDGIDVREVYFWGEGDPDRCTFLIEHFIHGIGKRANTGAGQIIGVRAQEIGKDYSWVTPKMVPARPLPAHVWAAMGLPEALVGPAVVSLPYWETAPVDAVFPTVWSLA
jgi:hypothetical protein